MRVHGDKIIRRSCDVKKQNNYLKYYDNLKEDFYNMCGYCGKNCDHYLTKYQIDHFVPKDIDDSRINDYTNLVLSCRKCNRAKWNDWPTKDKDKSNNGKKGYVDPACEQFDNHLARDEEGYIKPISDVGKYMYEVLKFDVRATNIIWMVNILSDRVNKLDEIIKLKENKTAGEIGEYEEYYNIQSTLKKYMKDLFANGETT